jgi:hypothetical protein
MHLVNGLPRGIVWMVPAPATSSLIVHNSSGAGADPRFRAHHRGLVFAILVSRLIIYAGIGYSHGVIGKLNRCGSARATFDG